ncbi:MAG TPA: ABC transporter ATP-binding protein [Spirochaetia bacterium]|nr:ABC transporter ATP-binding protein [Spirochaetia bacterium]
MIQARGLVKRFGAFTAVNGVDLNIDRGEVYGFLGPNGAGKTTTIMMLLGITRPTEGEVRLFGEPAGPRRTDLRRRVGVVPERHPRGVWPWMTAEEYLSLFADLFEVSRKEQRIAELLERVDLLRFRWKRIREFSRGMLQKLSIVRALLPDPDLLLLDEPISGLDPLGIKQVRDLVLAENRGGRSIFISSHQLSEMEKICHRVAIIFRGKLLVEDRMKSLLARLSPQREMHVELDRPDADLPARVRTLPFVEEAAVRGNTLVVKMSRQGDHRRDLSQHLISLGLVPLSIEEKIPSLEEAFVTITQENVLALAQGGPA